MALKAEEIRKLYDAPVSEFIQISKYKVAFKTLDFLDNQFSNFEVQNKTVDLPLCTVYFVNCLSILSCYMFDIPSFHFTVNSSYIRIKRQEVLHNSAYKGANFIYQDKYINVIHSDEGATLIFPSKLSKVIKPEMVRKTDKKGD